MIDATGLRYGLLAFSASLAIATGSPALGQAETSDSVADVGLEEVDGLSGEEAIELLTRSYRCTGCDFTGAQLGAANLEGAPLQGSNFTGANLAGVNLSNANLTGADLTNANLAGADLRRATLANATLSGARFNDARLLEAVLTSAEMSGAILAGANVRSANFNGATGLSLAGALQQCETVLASGAIENSGCETQNAEATTPADTPQEAAPSAAAVGTGDSTANVATLLSTNACPGCDLSGQNLRIQDLRNADLNNANLSETDLRNANLSNANLSNANLQGTVLSGTDLTGANLTGAALLNNGVGYIYCRTTLPDGRIDNSDCGEAQALSDAANQSDRDDQDSSRRRGGSGVGRFLGGLLGALVGVEPTPSDDRANDLTPAMIEGNYRRIPVQNSTHSGAIRLDGTGGWFWINDAGQRWSLTPDMANNRLLTGSDNPFGNGTQRDFELVFSNGDVSGFRFLGDLYDRTSFGQSGK